MTVRLGSSPSGHPRQVQRHLSEHEKGDGGPRNSPGLLIPPWPLLASGPTPHSLPTSPSPVLVAAPPSISGSK